MTAEDTTWENQHRLSTGRSAPTANGTEYNWRRLRWKVGYSGFLGPGFRLFSRFFVVSRSFLIASIICRLACDFGANSACYG